ncbi:MAG: ABC transporter permease [Gammaproteobacteria bacterium]|nr:ABC transporter permease [Gammaproteobacteria bacterium]
MADCPIAEIEYGEGILIGKGAWIARKLEHMPQQLMALPSMEYVISGAEITAMDTAGALYLSHFFKQLTGQKIHYRLEAFRPEWLELIRLIADHPSESVPSAPSKLSAIALLGKDTLGNLRYFFNYFNFIGQIISLFISIVRHPHKFHFKTIVNTADQAGARALPIVGLLCFLIGVVLAYQLGIQLKTYGANILIVFLTGVAILREFGPLIAAIIMAGRTSSAFTAEIGSMKVNQEIDALQVMGLSPIEFLVIPKVIAMLIVFPLLIFWADLFGVLGSMLMANFSLGVGYQAFLHQFVNTVNVDQFLIGLSKAPIFALIIVLVGCYQGFQVEYSADSIGKKTTKSVVQAIFLIIIADALFSILYGNVGA